MFPRTRGELVLEASLAYVWGVFVAGAGLAMGAAALLRLLGWPFRRAFDWLMAQA